MMLIPVRLIAICRLTGSSPFLLFPLLLCVPGTGKKGINSHDANTHLDTKIY